MCHMQDTPTGSYYRHEAVSCTCPGCGHGFTGVIEGQYLGHQQIGQAVVDVVQLFVPVLCPACESKLGPFFYMGCSKSEDGRSPKWMN